MPAADDRVAIIDQAVKEGVGKGLLHLEPEDDMFSGRVVTLQGKPRVFFGSCSYLGLELDPRLRSGAIEAIHRYGTQFSTSRAFIQSPQYSELETLLSEVFGGHVMLAPTTSLGHLATLPVLVGAGEAVILDQNVHASVQMAANLLRAEGTEVDVVRHNDLDGLEQAVRRLAATHRKVWYFADGVYSMFADVAPFERLRELLSAYEPLHLYIDDSHGVGWAGRHGRGPALDVLAGHPRVVVACSLAKSFGCVGGAIVFPDEELCRKVRAVGGPMIFSGPIQPPLLGAAISSARIHLSDELPLLQAALVERIELFTDLCASQGVPLAASDKTPIRYVPLGLPAVTNDVIENVMADGFYVNPAIFPAVPVNRSGVRLTLTLHHTHDDVADLVASLARQIPAALERGGPAARKRYYEITGIQCPAEDDSSTCTTFSAKSSALAG